MKRLMLTALMGCILTGQIKAGQLIDKVTRVALMQSASGVADSIFAGGLLAASVQAYHVSQHNFLWFNQIRSRSQIFIFGRDEPNIEPSVFFNQNAPIPNFGYRFAYWTSMAGFGGAALVALAKLYTTVYPTSNGLSYFGTLPLGVAGGSFATGVVALYATRKVTSKEIKII